MPIREPSPIPHLLFESPWPVVVVLAVVALGLLIAGSRRANGRLQLAGLGMFVLAGGAWLLAWAVTTDRERIMLRTEQLVAATAPLDMATLRSLVAEDAIVTDPEGDVWYDWPAAQHRLEQTLEDWPLSEQAIRALAAETDGDAGRSAIDLRTTIAAIALPTPSTWELHWRRTSDGQWRVREIRWLTLQGQDPKKGTWR